MTLGKTMIQVHDVDLRLLRVFDAVVRCGGFSAAQAELNVGQSTISTQIGQLEVRLGVRLCERGRAGFHLNEQGRAAHEATQRLLSAIDNFRFEADVLKKAVTGTLNLGLIDNTVTDRRSPLRAAIECFLARGPGIGIHVYIGSPNELEQRVLDGRLHAAIGHFPYRVPGLEAVALYEEVHGLFCGARHPLANPALSQRKLIEQVRTARVAARTYMRRRDLDLLGVASTASTADSVEAQAILILSNSCIGFLPLHYAAAWVEQGELVQLIPKSITLKSDFSAITRRLQPTPLVRSFLSDLDEAANAARAPFAAKRAAARDL
jgi:LysR family transcriptional regulator, transcriptional activator for bauABCD operon